MAIASPRKQTVNHKRAHGQHHKQDHHYLKAYHPYLPLLLLVIVGLAINVFWSSQSKVSAADASVSSLALLQDTNSERGLGHENNLTLNDELNQAAQAKANDMVNRNYWSHDTPDGKTPWTFVKNSGYSYHLAGENLAYGFIDAQDVITGWMNSPEHRANLLNAKYDDVGFGVASSPNYQGKGQATVVVAMYGAPSSDSAVGAAPADAGAGSFAAAQSPYHAVSRIQMLTGGHAPWSFGLIIGLVMLGAAALIVRHAKAWHKLVVRGEAFILHHKTFDLVVLSLVVIGVVMSRAAGFIG